MNLAVSWPPTSSAWATSPEPQTSRSSRNAAPVRHDYAHYDRRDDGDRNIQDQRAQPNIESVGRAIQTQRRERLQPVAPRRPRPPADAGRPAEQEGLCAEPAREQPEHQRGERLQDPQAPEQLQVERILRRQEQDEGKIG